MSKLTYNGKTFPSLDNETVLECLIRHNESISHSCKSGICHSCLLKVDKGEIDKTAQKGLSRNQIEQNVIFSCLHKITSPLSLIATTEGTNSARATIERQIKLSASVMEITIHLKDDLNFKAGQFVNIVRSDGLCRSYSIANLPLDNQIKLHIRHVPNGKMSNWLFTNSLIGTELTIKGPVGDCFYRSDFKEDNILLIGTGSGLAPLFGIVQDVLQSQHSKEINLFHAAIDEEGLYLCDKLRSLEERYPHFHYHPCVKRGDNERYLVGDVVNIISDLVLSERSTTAFVCGDPMIVNKLKQIIFLKGVPSKKIFSDPFVLSFS
ncbi:MAG: FAD-binding oxidoreductase [Bacteriovorax sp.]